MIRRPAQLGWLLLGVGIVYAVLAYGLVSALAPQFFTAHPRLMRLVGLPVPFCIIGFWVFTSASVWEDLHTRPFFAALGFLLFVLIGVICVAFP